MSRIGKKPIAIDKDIKVTVENKSLALTGPKGSLSLDMKGDISVEVKDEEIVVTRADDRRENKALHGLYRSLIQNMVSGVKDGYSKTLNLVGVGYKAEMKGNNLFIYAGYSHPIIFSSPEGITIVAKDQTTIEISGIDKQLVGLVAAKIRSFRPPEPYKGKGIKYSGEHIRRKAGKTAAI
jgi:large subunit ribosomal protein L6